MAHVPNSYRLEPYGQPLYASFLAALQEFIGTAALNFHLTIVPPAPGTTSAIAVQVVAGEASAQVGLGVDGLWRYNYATVNTTISGAEGVYDVFATCEDNTFDANPAPPPPELDDTVYGFKLEAHPSGATPSVSGSVTHWRKVGEVDWSGTIVTGLRALVGEVDARAPLTPTAPAAAITPMIVRGADGQAAPIQVWYDSVDAVLASLSAAGELTLAQSLAAVNAVLSRALTADSAALRTLSVGGVATLGADSTVPTVADHTDRTDKISTTEFVQNRMDDYIPTTTYRSAHMTTWDDQTHPTAGASVVSSCVVTLAAGQTCKLVGVKAKCTSAGGSVFKIRTDNGAHGTPSDVAELVGITPATGAYVQTTLGTPLTLADGDEVAVIASTPGSSLGVKIALVFEDST